MFCLYGGLIILVVSKEVRQWCHIREVRVLRQTACTLYFSQVDCQLRKMKVYTAEFLPPHRVLYFCFLTYKTKL